MRRVGDPDFVYRPWSEERRRAAKKAAAIRIYGSAKKAEKARAKKLQQLVKERDTLQRRLNIVKASINHYQRYRS